MEEQSASVVQQVLTTPEQDRAQVVAQGLRGLSEQDQTQVVTEGLRSLPEPARREVAEGTGWAPPTGTWGNIIWLILISSFCLILVGGGYLLYVMSRDHIDTAVVAPVITTVLGALVGLLAPSPVQQRGGSGG